MKVAQEVAGSIQKAHNTAQAKLILNIGRLAEPIAQGFADTYKSFTVSGSCDEKCAIDKCWDPYTDNARLPSFDYTCLSTQCKCTLPDWSKNSPEVGV